MKYLLALALVLLLAGCATSEEERDFFNRGWWNPEAGSERRMNAP